MRALLQDVAAGRVLPEMALTRIGSASADLGFATVDRHRGLRCGFPEVIFCQGKTPEHVVAIATDLLCQCDRVLLTRAAPEHREAISRSFPDAHGNEVARTIRIDRSPRPPRGSVVVVAAGTADLPVAEEAIETAEALGAMVTRIVDVGVAGLHRLAPHVPTLRGARVVVAVAGMEGALPSVIGGLVDVPVIAVPTSVGYGASFGGLAALLGMLNSCAAGVTVVNIDNGFGAGYAAALVNRGSDREEPR